MKNIPLKRYFDIFLATILILFFLPFFIFISLLIIIFDELPIFYVQRRVGLMGKQFYMYKFRTMKNKKEKDNKDHALTLYKDNRITRIGSFLRNLKLDELPQLINVFKGDMSLVGPRPELKLFTDLYDKKEKEILLIKPGITDISSLVFRNESDFLKEDTNPEFLYLNHILPLKLKLGLVYKNNAHLINDLNILLITFLIIFFNKKLLISNFIIEKSFRKEIYQIEKQIKFFEIRD